MPQQFSYSDMCKTRIGSLYSKLTHWGRVTHICVRKLAIISSDNGLSPGRRQAIICTNAGILLIGPLWTNFSETLIEILTFLFKKMCLKVSSAKRRPLRLGLNVLKQKQNHDDVIKWKHFCVTGHLCGEFTGPAQRPVTWSYDVFFDLRLNERLSKQSGDWWFETTSFPLYVTVMILYKQRISIT